MSVAALLPSWHLALGPASKSLKTIKDYTASVRSLAMFLRDHDMPDGIGDVTLGHIRAPLLCRTSAHLADACPETGIGTPKMAGTDHRNPLNDWRWRGGVLRFRVRARPARALNGRWVRSGGAAAADLDRVLERSGRAVRQDVQVAKQPGEPRLSGLKGGPSTLVLLQCAHLDIFEDALWAAINRAKGRPG
jgi:hypothetical protein